MKKRVEVLDELQDTISKDIKVNKLSQKLFNQNQVKLGLFETKRCIQ